MCGGVTVKVIVVGSLWYTRKRSFSKYDTITLMYWEISRVLFGWATVFVCWTDCTSINVSHILRLNLAQCRLLVCMYPASRFQHWSLSFGGFVQSTNSERISYRNRCLGQLDCQIPHPVGKWRYCDRMEKITDRYSKCMQYPWFASEKCKFSR